jgi:hypothetical protein
MLTGLSDVPGDGVLMGSGEPSRLMRSNPLGHVSQDRHDPLLGQARIEPRSAFAFGESRFAGRTAEHPSGFVGSVPHRHRQIPPSTFARIRTRRVLAAELNQVIPDPSPRTGRMPTIDLKCCTESSHARATQVGHHHGLVRG